MKSVACILETYLAPRVVRSFVTKNSQFSSPVDKSLVDLSFFL